MNKVSSCCGVEDEWSQSLINQANQWVTDCIVHTVCRKCHHMCYLVDELAEPVLPPNLDELMPLVSHFKILAVAPVNSSHERIAEVSRELQNTSDKQHIEPLLTGCYICIGKLQERIKELEAKLRLQ